MIMRVLTFAAIRARAAGHALSADAGVRAGCSARCQERCPEQNSVGAGQIRFG